MAWWNALFRRRSGKSLMGAAYWVTSTLYSHDGKREAKICVFENGATYLLESDWLEGTTFKERHDGRPVGPFKSPKDAERFIVGTAWFNGQDN